jgi:branched-chain amino acid transport system permease protein
MAIVGGMGSVFGPTLGALALLTVQEAFRSEFQQASLLIYGVVIVLVVRFAPEGISGWFKAFLGRLGHGRGVARRLTQG